MHPILIAVLAFVIVLAIVRAARRTAERVRSQIRIESRANTDEQKQGWRFGLDVGMLMAVGKLVWRWRQAPEGSLAHLGWHIFAAAAIAFIIWTLLRLIDRRINGPEPAVVRGYQPALGDK